MEITNEFQYVNREFTNRFKSIGENRTLKRPHLNKLGEELILNGSFYQPIIVNKRTNNIIDGNHRIQIFKELIDKNSLPINSKIAVKYIDIEELIEKKTMVTLNTSQVSWSLDDYIVSHSIKNPEYRKLIDWTKSHSLSFNGKKPKYRYAAAILKGVSCGGLLKNGDFYISNDDCKNGEEIHNELVQIISVLNKPISGNFIESLALSWYKVRDLHQFKEWLKELKAKKNIIDKKSFSNKKDWDFIFSIVSTAINVKNK